MGRTLAQDVIRLLRRRRIRRSADGTMLEASRHRLTPRPVLSLRERRRLIRLLKRGKLTVRVLGWSSGVHYFHLA